MIRLSFERALGVLLFALTVILSVLMVRSPGTYDIATFLKWTEGMYQHGFVAGFALAKSEYPPIGFAILYGSRAVGEVLGLSPVMSFKVAILGFQLLSAGMMLLVSGSFWIAAAFNGSILLSAVCLGYMDVCFAPPLIAAFWAYRSSRPVLGTALFLLACFIKWQPLIAAPFVAVYLLGLSNLHSFANAFRQKLFWQLTALVGLFVVPSVLIFGYAPVRSLLHGINLPILSGTALNVPWIAGFLYDLSFAPGFSPRSEIKVLSPPFAYLLMFKLAFAVFFVAVLVLAIRAEKTLENCLLFSIVGLVTYATWNTNVHENHWFLAVVLAYLLVALVPSREHYAVAAAVSIMSNINLFVFYGVTGTQLQSPVVGFDLTLVLAVLYAVAWLALGAYAWDRARAP